MKIEQLRDLLSSECLVIRDDRVVQERHCTDVNEEEIKFVYLTKYTYEQVISVVEAAKNESLEHRKDCLCQICITLKELEE